MHPFGCRLVLTLLILSAAPRIVSGLNFIKNFILMRFENFLFPSLYCWRPREVEGSSWQIIFLASLWWPNMPTGTIKCLQPKQSRSFMVNPRAHTLRLRTYFRLIWTLESRYLSKWIYIDLLEYSLFFSRIKNRGKKVTPTRAG